VEGLRWRFGFFLPDEKPVEWGLLIGYPQSDESIRIFQRAHMKQGNGEGWWWLAGLGLLASVWAGGATRAESLPDAWAFDLLARVEQWQSAGPLDVLPVAAREQPVPAATQARIQAGYGRLPLHFEPNIGQTAEAVHFVARGPGYTLFLTADEAVLALRPARPAAERADPRAHRRPFDFAARSPEATPAVPGAVLRTRLEGATLNPAPRPEGLDRQPGISNYLLGNDPAKWRTRVPHYARVRYPEVYPGIDLVYYGNPQRLEHDFIVAPGADPAVIRLAVRGAEEATVNAKGDLVLKVPGGEVVQQAPTIYQMIDGEQRAVAGRYVLREAAPGAGATVAVAAANPVPAPLQIGFEIARYDRTQPLVIDPALVYATYFSDSYSDGIAVDDAGHAYVTGDTASTDFPTTPDALQPSHGGSWDAFVAKLNANGTALVYATYLGGSGDDGGKGIAVDGAGHAYVTGDTFSPDFPTTPGALRPSLGGSRDAFVAQLDAGGTALVYSTYLGGGHWDSGNGIAVDGAGHATVTGATYSTDFPTTPGALQSSYGGSEDAFVARLDAGGTALVYSTYLGGYSEDDGTGIAVDGAGHAYVTGDTASPDFPTTPGALQPGYGGGAYDTFVAKLNAGGTALVYSTYLGGGHWDSGNGIAVDGAGHATVTGWTDSPDFPTTPGALQSSYGGSEDAFVARLDAGGTALVYATYLGGGDVDWGTAIAVDGAGHATVTGATYSTDFPTTPNALQPSYGGGAYDTFVAKLNAGGTALVYATYLGYSDDDYGSGIAVDGAGNAYVTGSGTLRIWTTAFVAKLLTNPAQHTAGLYNPATSTFYLKNSHAGGAADIVFRYGPANAGWTPLAGDWDGDGTATVGLFDPATSTFYLRNSHSAGVADLAFRFGPSGRNWLPLVGDWDGNGTATVGLFDPATSTFYLRNSHSAGVADLAFRFGPAGKGWTPLTGDWDGNGTATVGLFDPATSTFYLRNSHSAGAANLSFRYGPTNAGWTPLAGDWNGPGL